MIVNDLVQLRTREIFCINFHDNKISLSGAKDDLSKDR